jgi:protein phosphatase
VLALLAGGGYGAYRWSQTQYYVGAAGDRIAIYKGLSQKVFGMQLSSVYTRSAAAVADLPPSDKDNVTQTIPASNLDEARKVVAALEGRAKACALARQQAQQPKPPPPKTTPPAKPKNAKGTQTRPPTTNPTTPPPKTNVPADCTTDGA